MGNTWKCKEIWGNAGKHQVNKENTWKHKKGHPEYNCGWPLAVISEIPALYVPDTDAGWRSCRCVCEPARSEQWDKAQLCWARNSEKSSVLLSALLRITFSSA